MQHNTAVRRAQIHTAGGAPAFPHLKPLAQLRRLVMACLLWEDEFYVDGKTLAEQIVDACAKVSAQELADLAIEARQKQHLRHVPLLLLCELAKKGGPHVSRAIAECVQRADEISELVSLYWREKKRPLSKQLKKGLRAAFLKFSAHQLAKYDREKAVRLRDVMFLVHPKPRDEAQAADWKALVDGTLPAPDTWEVALSAGADKRESFERLLRQEKLGYFALLRNLRGMAEAGVDVTLIRDAIVARKGGAEKILPFRFIAAARAAPRFERELDLSLIASIADLPRLSGRTVVLVDVSGSMAVQLSARSDLTRMDAACALASVINGDVRMFSFSNLILEVPPRRGMAGVDALKQSQQHGGTALAQAIHFINSNVPCERLIVITDEQATDGRVPDAKAPRAYMVNVASYRNGVGYGKWIHIDGFSENVIRWIFEQEASVDA